MFRNGEVWTYAAVVVFCLAVAAPWFNIPRDQADSAGMLAHLHGHFVTYDLLYDDEYGALKLSPLFAFLTPEGIVSNHWPTGATWLQAPGYGLGLVAARVLAAFGVGTGAPMGVVVLLALRAWALVVLAGCAVVVARWFARSGAGRAGGWLAAACFIVGTPALYYAAESPLRPHLWGMAVTLVFTRIWAAPNRSTTGAPLLRPVALGALAGLAAAVRPQLAPLVLLALYDAASTAAVGHRLRAAIATLVAFGAWPLLAARMQVWMYGPDLNHYAAGGVSHHLAPFLMSPYHGVLVWCPIVALGLGAVAWAVVQRERGAWLIALILLGQLWLDSGTREITPYHVLGTRTWAGGVAFGPRKLLDVLPLCLPALTALTAAVRERRAHRPLAAVALALVVPTAILHAAAFVDPDLTLATVHDGPGLLTAMASILDGDRIGTTLAERALPTTVALVVTALVTAPLGLALWRARHATLFGLAVGTLGLALVAHAWVAFLQLRTDALTAADPARMQRFADEAHPKHEAAVARIPGHHATLRAILGENAAPPK